jgi:Tfp pilus assembly protein PilF
MAAQSQGGTVRNLEKIPLASRSMNSIVVYVTYLWQTVYPHDLAAYYPYPHSDPSWIVVGLAAALLLSITVAAIAWFRRYPFLLVGWFWYLGTLVPVIGLVQIGGQQMADRYTYFPLIGVFIAVVWLIAEIAPAGLFSNRLLRVVALATLLEVAIATFIQIGYWQDGLTLFRRALNCTPDNAFAEDGVGLALIRKGEFGEAIEYLEAATRRAPWVAQPHHNLGVAYQCLGRLDEAATQYRAALATDEQQPDTHNNLGVILWKRSRFQDAERHFRRALEIQDNFLDAYVNLGALYEERGKHAEAIADCQRALKIDPQLLKCHQTIALALRAQGRWDEAISHFQYLVAASPGNQQARLELLRTMAMKRGSGNP